MGSYTLAATARRYLDVCQEAIQAKVTT